MWVLNTPDGYKLYTDEETAIDKARELTGEVTEEHVQGSIDQLGDQDLYTPKMAVAADYIESKGLGDGRVSTYIHNLIYDVSGLKKELGRDGWAELVILLGMGYEVHPIDWG